MKTKVKSTLNVFLVGLFVLFFGAIGGVEAQTLEGPGDGTSNECYRKMEANCQWGIRIVCRKNAPAGGGACTGGETCDYC